ncbi:MAG TPA: DedA family protein [Chloroflexota bacterium]|nr:DedA family protein [Chloroflexota bacterium]
MDGLLGPVTSWATNIVESMGYPGVFFLMMLEGIFPPIPSEVILPLAGFLTGQGRFSLWIMLLVSTAGSVAIALVLYGLAYSVGRDRLREWADRHGKWIALEKKDIDKADKWFHNHGKASVFFGRFVPVVRSLISVPAGFAHMNLVGFVLFTAAGSAIWNGLLIGLGWYFGERWEQVRQYFQYFEYAVLAGLVLGVGWWLWKRVHHKGEDKADAPSEDRAREHRAA